jgi:type I restriction enzyme M protein
MARKSKTDSGETSTGSGKGTANLGFEQKLWLAADKLRGTMDAADYKHTVLGLIFLKYISDSFEARHQWIVSESSDPQSEYYIPQESQRSTMAEDRDEYLAENVFWVPPKARWMELQNNAKQPTIGKLIDDAMVLIERENPSLKGILPKNFARPDLDKTRLGELIDLIGTILVGDEKSRSQDVLGRVYEYFLGKFASAEGKGGGEFYTPSCIVRVLVEMIEPYKGRVYDPCCGSGGMFVQSEKFAEAHGGRRSDISVYGQESNPTTWRLAQMNLAIRGIESHLGDQWADTFAIDKHPDLKADFILANPPFNISDWGGERLKEDKRWVYGVPPTGNANFAWVQHFIHHLAPNGIAGFVLANGSMSSNSGGEGDIRKAIVQADLVDCMVSMPGQLFYSTQIPVCLWFLTRNKAGKGMRDRRGETLFIDARKMGTLTDRVHRELSDEDIQKITNTYHAWRGEKDAGKYEDVAGFCNSATRETIEKHGFVLTPGRYVGAADVEDDGEQFAEKMKRLVTQLNSQFAESVKLEKSIKANLKELGYGT